jgi:hypothetical protein
MPIASPMYTVAGDHPELTTRQTFQAPDEGCTSPNRSIRGDAERSVEILKRFRPAGFGFPALISPTCAPSAVATWPGRLTCIPCMSNIKTIYSPPRQISLYFRGRGCAWHIARSLRARYCTSRFALIFTWHGQVAILGDLRTIDSIIFFSVIRNCRLSLRFNIA